MPVVEAVRDLCCIVMKTSATATNYCPRCSRAISGSTREVAPWKSHPAQRAPYKQLAAGPVSGSPLRTPALAVVMPWRSSTVSRRCSRAAPGPRYAITPQHLELQAGMPVPVWQVL